MTGDGLIEELKRLPAGTEILLRDISTHLSASEAVETGEANEEGAGLAQVVV